MHRIDITYVGLPVQAVGHSVMHTGVLKPDAGPRLTEWFLAARCLEITYHTSPPVPRVVTVNTSTTEANKSSLHATCRAAA